MKIMKFISQSSSHQRQEDVKEDVHGETVEFS